VYVECILGKRILLVQWSIRMSIWCCTKVRCGGLLSWFRLCLRARVETGQCHHRASLPHYAQHTVSLLLDAISTIPHNNVYHIHISSHTLVKKATLCFHTVSKDRLSTKRQPVVKVRLGSNTHKENTTRSMCRLKRTSGHRGRVTTRICQFMMRRRA
jgi:hypothetical protein